LTDKPLDVISFTKSIATSAFVSIGGMIIAIAVTYVALVNAGFENANPNDGSESQFYAENGITPKDMVFFFLEWMSWFSMNLHRDTKVKQQKA